MALALDIAALACFGDWIAKTDWLFGHVYGPASSILAALWTAGASLVLAAAWIGLTVFRRFSASAGKATKRNWSLLIQGVILVALLPPVGLIAALGVSELPRARGELQTQRIRAGDASVTDLIEALKSGDSGARFWALQELKKRGPQAQAAVPALAEALKDPAVDDDAAKALAAIGPGAEPAIPALIETIQREKGKRSGAGYDTPSVTSWLAGQALTSIGPGAIPELIALLKHPDRYVRMSTVNALGNMGPQAFSALPALRETFNDEDEVVRQWGRVAIDRIENRRPVVSGGPATPGPANRGPANPAPADRSREFDEQRTAVAEDAIPVQETPSEVWTTQPTYTGDPLKRPPGAICVTFDDGYRWLIAGSVLRREKSVEGGRKIEAAITGTRRYEHALGTHEVRIIDLMADSAVEVMPTASQDHERIDNPGEEQ
jgi:hypothetical protein